MLVSERRDAYGAFAHAESILHIPIIASRGEHVYKGFPHPERQRLHQPPQGLAAAVQGGRIVVSAELPRLASRCRSPRRNPHPRALRTGGISIRFNMTNEQSDWNAQLRFRMGHIPSA